MFAVGLLMASGAAWSQVASGSLDVHWSEGAADCKANPQAPIQVHAYNPQTFILRENLCATFEARFMYLLIGSKKALLIDTGDVKDPPKMPLEKTVMNLLPADGAAKLRLLVVHTHRHLDHRAGDGQFAHLPNVQVVGFDLDSVRYYYNFTNWPNGLAQINLGDRIVDVILTPGHNATHVSFYYRNTALFFSGDFLMPARLLIDDADADLASVPAGRDAGSAELNARHTCSSSRLNPREFAPAFADNAFRPPLVLSGERSIEILWTPPVVLTGWWIRQSDARCSLSTGWRLTRRLTLYGG